MGFAELLWLMVWGGMFTGIYNLQSSYMFGSLLTFVQGSRAILPLLAAYLCFIWILVTRSRYPFSGNPVGFLLYYCLIGVCSSLFLSPDKVTAFYWAIAYLSPILAMWFTLERTDRLASLRRLLYINYGIVILIALSLLPKTYKIYTGRLPFSRFRDLPFSLGQITVNGAGRYALIVIVLCSVRAITQKKASRFAWLVLLVPMLVLLAQTQSRTSLLGLAVVSMLFVFLKGIDLRFLLIAPVSTYIIWLSGVQWRVQGNIDRLFLLSGRQYTWHKGLAQIKQSPVLGWGFHADRIMLNSEHMHNSYLHAAIHAGAVGAILFLLALISFWLFVLRADLIRRVKSVRGADQALLVESILIISFLTARSFFESTGAFYGVDLLLLVPSMSYIYEWVHEHAETSPE
jgi:O-antigen ligase